VSDGPFAGLTVIVARDEAPDDDMSRAIAAAGATVIPLPLMQVAPPIDDSALRAALDHLHRYRLIAFTSRHGVRAVAALCPPPAGVMVAAVGHATAAELAKQGWPVDVVGDQGGAALAAAIVLSVGPRLRHGPVLLPQADGANDALRQGLVAAGVVVDVVVAYRSVPIDPGAVQAATARAMRSPRPLVLLVTSPRRVDAFCDALLCSVSVVPEDLAVVAVGVTTAAAVIARGLRVAAQASSPATGPVCAALATLHNPH
jgi:uroporphyrinogen-III synthase